LLRNIAPSTDAGTDFQRSMLSEVARRTKGSSTARAHWGCSCEVQLGRLAARVNRFGADARAHPDLICAFIKLR